MSKFFSGLFGSLIKQALPIEKALKNTCFAKDNFEEIDYDDLLKMILFLQQKHDATKQQNTIQSFFKYIKDLPELSLQKRLKFLALIHKGIKKIGFEFAEEFLNSRPVCLREKPSADNKKQNQKQQVFHYMDIESWLEEYILKHYYDYLMRLSLNLETYRSCLSVDENNKNENFELYQTFPQEVQGITSQNNSVKIIVLFKINNLVNFLSKLQKQFYIIFTEFKFIAVAKDMAYMVLKDCMIYYNYMHRQVMNMVTNYESMIENDQMQFYELFIELIKLNSTLHDFGKLRKFFDEEESIEQPLTLNITKERARQIDRNHRKIVLKSEELQKERKYQLQLQLQNKNKDPSDLSIPNGSLSATHGKKLSFFPKQGSMTSRGQTWKQYEQICEVTNDDEDEENQKQKFKINKNGILFQAQPSGGVLVQDPLVATINFDSAYGIDSKGGFNTDRVTYLRNPKDFHDEEKSESTKETKKDDTFSNKKEIPEQ